MSIRRASSSRSTVSTRRCGTCRDQVDRIGHCVVYGMQHSEPQAADSLGGVDTLVFAGGIGEHAASVRHRVCSGTEFPCTELDPTRNAVHADVISGPVSRATVRFIRTHEKLTIVRSVSR